MQLHGVVLVGRRPAPKAPSPSAGGSAISAEPVEIAGLTLQIEATGLVVEGPHPGVLNTVNWRRIGSLEIGAVVSLADGTPARPLEFDLDDRTVQFLVPVTELGDDRLRALIRLRDAHLAPVVVPPPLEVVTVPPAAQTPLDVPDAAPPQATPQGPQAAPRGILLPPAPPSSKVAMPPAPSQVESSTKNDAGSGNSNGSNPSNAALAFDETLLRPRAVPSATRVSSPRNLDGASVLATVPEVAVAAVAAAPATTDSSLVTATPAPTEMATATASPDLPEDLEVPSAGSRHVPGARRRPLLVGTVVVVLAVAGVTIGFKLDHHGSSSVFEGNRPGGVATKSSSGTSTPVLYGPGPGANPQTVASVLNIDLAELPSGWRSGKAPWPRLSTTQANSALAGCLGIPTADVGIVTGTNAPSGPSVISSAWATNAVHGSTGLTGFESAVVLTGSELVARSDLGGLDTSRSTPCLQGWFASLDQSGDQIVGVPSISRFSPTVGAGELTAGFHISIVTGSTSAPRPVNEDILVISAGRIEVALFGQTLSGRVSSSIEASLISGISNRLAAEAAS